MEYTAILRRADLRPAFRALLLFFALQPCATPLSAQVARVDELTGQVLPKVISWRRDFHQNPELSNREFRTAAVVAAHLRSLGMQVDTGIAHTGVAALLTGGRPGPRVALRADMDALPVTERVDLPFASKVQGTYLGQDVGVMHACGHDAHTAILMGVAEVLAAMRLDIPGSVLFIFQPAEEGAPPGEQGGAELMLAEGLFDKYRPEVVFGLHITADLEAGHIRYKPGSLLAAADKFSIRVTGRQSHGSRPWSGVDPIVTASQIVLGLQTIISRQVELTLEPAVLTVGKLTAGVRNNIIPETAEMVGTIRTFHPGMQEDIHARIRRTAVSIAESQGATAEVVIDRQYPVTVNDAKLTARMLPALFAAAGEERVQVTRPVTWAEDFSFYANAVPGLFFFLGGMPPGADPLQVPSHHTPDFFIDESGFDEGVRALSLLALQYLEGK